METSPDDHKKWHDIGIASYNQNQLSEAIQAYQKAIQCRPTCHKVRLDLGTALYCKEQYDEAIEAYQKAIEIKPDYHEAWCNFGKARYGKGQLSEAIEAYQKAIQFNPDYHEAWYNLGLALSEKGQTDEAIEAYQKAIQFKQDSHEALNNLGLALSEKGQIDEAIEAYQKAIQIEPDKYKAWNNLGNALLDKRQYDEAIKSCQKAIHIKLNYHKAWNNLGVALYCKGEYNEAIEAYQKAIQFKQDYHKAWCGLGASLYHKGQIDEAIKAYQKTIRFKPDLHEAWTNLGIAFGDFLNQIENNRNSGQVSAYDIINFHYIKVLREKCNNISLAIKAISRNQAGIETYLLTAKNVWLPYQKWEEAKSCIDNVLEREPQHFEALVIQAEIDLATGNPTTVAALLNEYDSLDFESLDKQIAHDIKLRFMNLFESIGNTDKAIECLTSAYVDDIDRGTCEYHQARILWEKRRDLTKPKEILTRLLHYPTPQIYILDADIALHTGNFVRCSYSLEKAESFIDFGLMPLKDIRKWEELQEMCL